MVLHRRPDTNGVWSAKLPPGHTLDDIIALANAAGSIPTVRCKGRCQSACTVLPATPVEIARVEAKIGEPLTIRDDRTCTALDDNGMCRAYLVRPTVCALYGAAEGLMCEHGCETVDGRYLTYLEGVGFLMRDAARDGDHVPTWEGDDRCR